MFTKTIGIIGLTIKQKLAYREALWFGIMATSASILIYFFLWRAVFSDAATVEGYTFQMMITYIIIARILASQFSSGINGTLAGWIYDGSIATELLRPFGIIRSLFALRLGEFCQFVIFKGLPITLVAAFLLNASPPASGLSLLLFIVSILISLVLLFFFELMVGVLAFYTMEVHAVRFAKEAVLTILSGGLVPLFLFPQWLQDVFRLLPFQYLAATPIDIYLGVLSPSEALMAMLSLGLWIVIMMVLSLLFFNTAMKKVVVQGG
ncbi:MAG: ABC-2 family transporter protein [Defluviitaleaceae bacterium]|nr:ABC-2 family transporter protein [Defluviitaleaceae bacterium]